MDLQVLSGPEKIQRKLQISVYFPRVFALTIPLVDTVGLLETRGLQQTLVVYAVPVALRLAYF